MKYLKLPKSKQREILQEMAMQLNGPWKNKLEYSLPSPPEGIAKPKIIISRAVWDRILAYVNSTDMEIAWRGCVERKGNVFKIHKVFLYPQGTTRGTVVTEGAGNAPFAHADFTPYDKWAEALDDETYNTMRFQGHSHVSMHVNPSHTDLNSEHQILNNLNDKDFYLFLIINKSEDTRWALYDKLSNIEFEMNDLIVEIESSELLESVEDEKDKFIVEVHDTETTFIDISRKISTKFKLDGESSFQHCGSHGYQQVFTTSAPLSNRVKKRIKGDGGVFVSKIEKPISSFGPSYNNFTSNNYKFASNYKGLERDMITREEDIVEEEPSTSLIGHPDWIKNWNRS